MKKRLLSLAVVMGTSLVAMAQMTMDVSTKKLGAPIQSTMYGIFFEDINYAADPGHRDRRTGLVNEGYFGIGVKKGENYRFSVWAKAPKGNSAIRIQLIQENSMDEQQEFAEQKLDITSKEWKKYTVTLTATKTLKHAKLRIFLQYL